MAKDSVVGVVDTIPLLLERQALAARRAAAAARAREAEANIAALEVQRSIADRELARTERLLKQAAATAQQGDRAEHDARVAREQLAGARAARGSARQEVAALDAQVALDRRPPRAEPDHAARSPAPCSRATSSPASSCRRASRCSSWPRSTRSPSAPTSSNAQLTRLRLGQQVQGGCGPGRFDRHAPRPRHLDRVRGRVHPDADPDPRRAGRPGVRGEGRGGQSRRAGSGSGCRASCDRSERSAAAMSDGPAVEARGLVRRFGDDAALQDVSFDVAPGELYGVIGPDGAGKTTLFRILVTLLLPDAGTARVLGRDVVKDLWNLRTRIGYMPGRFSLYPDLSVAGEPGLLRRALRHHGRGGAGDDRADLGAARAVRRPPRRRALRRHEAEARALLRAGAPARDPLPRRAHHRGGRGCRKEFWDLLARLRDEGLPIVVSTPYMDEAIRCDRVSLMQDGTAPGHRPAGRDRPRLSAAALRRARPGHARPARRAPALPPRRGGLAVRRVAALHRRAARTPPAELIARELAAHRRVGRARAGCRCRRSRRASRTPSCGTWPRSGRHDARASSRAR